MPLSELLNIIVGGGFIATIVSVFTLRSTVKKASANAEQAAADAEQVRLDNTDKATGILMRNIVSPLETALDEVRQELRLTQNDLRRLQKAVQRANYCRYTDKCPVMDVLLTKKRDAEYSVSGKVATNAKRQRCAVHIRNDTDCEDGGESPATDGDPPQG